MVKGCPQDGVGGVTKETGTQRAQRFGDTVAQAVAGVHACFLACIAPSFPWAVTGFSVDLAKSAGVRQEPEGREVGIQLFAEQGLQVDLDIGRAREAGVVAQDAQRQPVAYQRPQRVVRRVSSSAGMRPPSMRMAW